MGIQLYRLRLNTGHCQHEFVQKRHWAAERGQAGLANHQSQYQQCHHGRLQPPARDGFHRRRPGHQQRIHRPRRPGGHRRAQLRQLSVQAAGRRAGQRRPAASPAGPGVAGQQPVRRPHRRHRAQAEQLLHQHERGGQQALGSGRPRRPAGQGQQPGHADPLGLHRDAEPARRAEHADHDDGGAGQQLPGPHRRPQYPDFPGFRQGPAEPSQTTCSTSATRL